MDDKEETKKTDKRGPGNPAWRDPVTGKTKSGNPNGAPKKILAFTTILRDIGNLKAGDIDKKHKLGNILWEMALSKDLAAIKYIYDRVDGRPKQYIELDDGNKMSDDISFDDMPDELKKEFIKELPKELREEIIEDLKKEVKDK